MNGIKKTLLASLMRARLVLEQPVQTADGAGGFIRTWQEVASLWAHIQPLNGSEQMDDGQLASAVRLRVRIRYRGDVAASMRLRHCTRFYNIRAVMHEDNRQLVLLCEEGTAV